MIKLLFISLLISINSYSQSPQQMFWMMNKSSAVTSADSVNFVNKVISNGGSLTSTEKTAIGTLIKQLKDSSLWSLMSCVYPFVGGTINSCKVNLINPNLYSLTFAPSNPTFASTGVKSNGTNYGITGLIPSSVLSLNSTSLSFYARDTGTVGVLDIGCNTSTFRTYMGPGGGEINNTVSTDVTSTTIKKGMFTISRTTSANLDAYLNGTSIMTSSTASTGLPNIGIYLFARNNNGTAANGSDRELAFVSIGLGLTAAQSLTLYNIVQAFQTTLGRQV